MKSILAATTLLRKGSTPTKRMANAAAVGVAMLIGGGVSAPPAQAGYVVTLEQEGSNVVATGSGTIDLADLSLVTTASAAAEVEPMIAFILTGPATGTPLAVYGHVTGPANFGSGSSFFASSGSGDVVAMSGLGVPGGTLAVPVNYVSGAALSDTSTYDNATLASLGATPGTYEWTWGTGAHADSFTVQVGPVVSVPEPASLPLLAMGLASVGLMRRTRLG